MLDGVPLSVADLSGWGAFLVIVFLVVVSFLRGWLYPKAALLAEKARGDTFKEAWERAQSASEAKDAAMYELLQNSRTTVRLLEALQQAASNKEPSP